MESAISKRVSLGASKPPARTTTTKGIESEVENRGNFWNSENSSKTQGFSCFEYVRMFKLSKDVYN